MTTGTPTPAADLTAGALVHGTRYVVEGIETHESDATRPVISAERDGGRMRVTLGAAADGSGPETLDVAYLAGSVLIVTPAPQGEAMLADDLNRWVEFGSPFRVFDGRRVASAYGDPDAFRAPELVYLTADDVDTLDEVPDGWRALTNYSGQYAYSGPVMHASEQLSGRIADDILSTPGLYVVVSVETYDEDDDTPAGWAVIAKADAA